MSRAAMTEMANGGMSFCRGIMGATRRYRALVASRRAISERKMIAAQTKSEIASRCRGSARFGDGAGTRHAYARVAMIFNVSNGASRLSACFCLLEDLLRPNANMLGNVLDA